MKLIIALLFLVSNYSFCQSKSIDFSLDLKDLSELPYYTNISETNGTKSVFKSSYKYLDSLTFYNLTYKSFDNLKIKGFLIRPQAKGNYPVLIFNRGGNADYGTIRFPFLIDFLAKIAKKGYVIIGSQLRGNSVSDGQDEFGGRDVNDVLSLMLPKVRINHLEEVIPSMNDIFIERVRK